MRTERDRARSLAMAIFVGPRCKGLGRPGPSMVFASKPVPGLGAFPEILLPRPSELCGAEKRSYAL